MTTASNVFGIGSEHPFTNYWTFEGGLPEVMSVLPAKAQADVLLARYFECVDPIYPMVHRQTFYADYEHFWRLSGRARDDADAAFIGLIFVMLALGIQFTSTVPKERRQTAEFYASAANQALRMSSYLSTASLRSAQAMVLMTYFPIDNHASDGWAFAGILVRQAYAMGLHRDPNVGRRSGAAAHGLVWLTPWQNSDAQHKPVREAAAAQGVAGGAAAGHVPDGAAVAAAVGDAHGRVGRRPA